MDTNALAHGEGGERVTPGTSEHTAPSRKMSAFKILSVKCLLLAMRAEGREEFETEDKIFCLLCDGFVLLANEHREESHSAWNE